MTRQSGKGRTKSESPWNVTAEEMNDARDWLAGHAVRSQGRERSAGAGVPPAGLGEMQVNVSVTGKPLCLAGKVYASGFGTHGECDLRIRLPAGQPAADGAVRHQRQRAHAGLRRRTRCSASRPDGREVWTSGPRKVASPPARFDVALRGAGDVMLKVRGPDREGARGLGEPEGRRRGTVMRVRRRRSARIFSFRYGGKPSPDLLAGWRLKAERRRSAAASSCTGSPGPTRRPGLAVICEIKEYRRFPVVEWVVRLKNTSRRKSPLIEDLRSMDLLVPRRRISRT